MTLFLRLAGEIDKAVALAESCTAVRTGRLDDSKVFSVPTTAFSSIPGKPFSYWVSEAVRSKFRMFPQFERDGRLVRQGLASADDNRFVRLWWEPSTRLLHIGWTPFTKGGAYSPFYYEQSLVVRWFNSGKEMRAFERSVIRSPELYFRPGITWPLRAKRFSPQVMPSGCVFSARGYSAFPTKGRELIALAVMSSVAFDYLFKSALGRFGYPEFIVGILQQLPWAEPNEVQSRSLELLSRRSWSLKRKLDDVHETSHAFFLPVALRKRVEDYCESSIEAELSTTQAEIDDVAFDLYGFSEADRAAALSAYGSMGEEASGEDADDSDDENSIDVIDQTDSLLSWAVGVAFGRFDWRLATGEREAPPEPDPFDPLPAKSPGMLPDGAAPFHDHSGLLVDDQGHPHDLPRLIEEVLTCVQTDVPADVRRWLQRDFFTLHLKQYSKSRRKAPIYWPLSTTSGSYTLWLYYPSLTSQTLYTAVNDFVEPKLKQVSRDAATLRDKGAARTRDDEKAFEALQALELELIELRDTLLGIAPTYRPNHDDGVQITAAPLWPLFRHKPWQKVLKDTWAKLEKGDYDWAHLAMTYWPDRVREKCKNDKSLAIAHDLEDLYEPAPSTEGGKEKKNGSGA